MEDTKKDGWFETHILDKFETLNSEITKLQDSLAKLHERIDCIHNPPCPEIITAIEKIGRLETSLGHYRWLMGSLVLGVIVLIISNYVK